VGYKVLEALGYPIVPAPSIARLAASDHAMSAVGGLAVPRYTILCFDRQRCANLLAASIILLKVPVVVSFNF